MEAKDSSSRSGRERESTVKRRISRSTADERRGAARAEV